MELFYTEHIQGATAIFSEEETRHISKAFRKRPGDTIYFTNGQGIRYEGKILELDKKRLTATIENTLDQPKTWTGQLSIAVSPTKNFSRIEWLVEKLVEIGIDHIIPLETDFSERKTWKMNRLNRIILSAVKQSQKCVFPILHDPVRFRDFISRPPDDTQFYIGHCYEGEKSALKDIKLDGQNVGFCIGPEGDFSQEEIGLAIKAGYKPISLGNSRLRTETAAFKMATAFQIINDIE